MKEFKKKARFRFYEELNDFLSTGKRKIQFDYNFNGKPSIKDAIEAIGIPHTEVDLIIVNGESVSFDYHLLTGDIVSVYPVFEGLDITPVVKLRDTPLRETKFVADVHLGKLVRLLRMLGFDVLYRNDYHDQAIITISVNEKRIILTRDRQLLYPKIVTHGYWVRSQNPQEQVVEVLKRFDLLKQINPFTRCLACNGHLHEVEKQDIVDRLEPLTIKYYNDFFQCDICKKVFWEGSHYVKLKNTLEKIKKSIKQLNVL
jgi:uncharacterized protein with PIN domain